MFTDKERAALRWTEELTLIADTGASVRPTTSSRRNFKTRRLGWLIFAAVQINSWNRIAISAVRNTDPAMSVRPRRGKATEAA